MNLLPHYRRRRPEERGVAAVEMAIVLPWLLLVVWAMIDMTLMMLSRQEVTRLAQTAARICVAQQPPPQNASANVKGCVNAQLIKYWASTSISGFCKNPSATVDANWASVSYGSQPLIWVVEVTQRCTYRPFTPGLAGIVPTIEGHATMPFLGLQ